MGSFSHNLLSAEQNPSVADEYLSAELALGRIVEYSENIENLHFSPLGVIPKKNKPGKRRHINSRGFKCQWCNQYRVVQSLICISRWSWCGGMYSAKSNASKDGCKISDLCLWMKCLQSCSCFCSSLSPNLMMMWDRRLQFRKLQYLFGMVKISSTVVALAIWEEWCSKKVTVLILQWGGGDSNWKSKLNNKLRQKCPAFCSKIAQLWLPDHHTSLPV